MTSYDYGRVQSLLEMIAESALGLRNWLQEQESQDFDVQYAEQRTWNVRHDLDAIKALLKRERVKRA